ncbi:unnamed protein product [Pleuronectes platessa]|uniref:Uncharacterized protein n=1 Tax=Pleuronectes platessa TaxID=8262 RepID=A0A9N7YNI3_PLEPL|nr:unnamed protein product [Pleuronectes platessa]
MGVAGQFYPAAGDQAPCVIAEWAGPSHAPLIDQSQTGCQSPQPRVTAAKQQLSVSIKASALMDLLMQFPQRRPIPDRHLGSGKTEVCVLGLCLALGAFTSRYTGR